MSSLSRRHSRHPPRSPPGIGVLCVVIVTPRGDGYGMQHSPVSKDHKVIWMLMGIVKVTLGLFNYSHCIQIGLWICEYLFTPYHASQFIVRTLSTRRVLVDALLVAWVPCLSGILYFGVVTCIISDSRWTGLVTHWCCDKWTDSRRLFNPFLVFSLSFQQGVC